MSPLSRNSVEIGAWANRFIEASIDPIVLLDSGGQILGINRAAASELGLTTQAIGRVFWHVFPETLHGQIWHKFNEARDTGLVVEGSDHDGRFNNWVVYQLSPIVFDAPEPLYVAMSWKVATRERLLQTSLDEADQALDFVLSLGGVVCLTSDLVTERVHFSRNGVKKFGRSSMSHEEFWAHVHAQDIATFRAFRNQTIELGGERAECDFRFVQDDGHILWFRLRAKFYPGAPGRNDQIRGIAVELGQDDDGARGWPGETTEITAEQIRAARGALSWSVRVLSERSRVSVSTIVRAEEGEGIASIRSGKLDDIRRALTTAGIVFFVDGNGLPSIAIGKAQDHAWSAELANETSTRRN